MNALPLSGVPDAADEDALRVLVEDAVRRLGGPRVRAVDRRRLAQSTSYRVEVVTAELSNGDSMRLFLKDFRESRLPKDRVSERRERELRIYEELLDGSGLGTPSFYGVRRAAARARFWLLLEYVDGELLSGCGYERWLDAAAWLGRLHGQFRDQRDRLATSSFLVRHDAEYFTRTSERALAEVSALSSGLARRLRDVLDRYEQVRPVLSEEADTLVHGSYRPQNVIVARTPASVRICPADWELGAFGRSAHDLGYLCDGFRAPRLDELLDAYEDAARSAGAAARHRSDLHHEVDCFRLHKCVNSLGHVARWSRPHETAPKVLAAAEELARAVA